MTKLKLYEKYVKRPQDVCLATMALVLLSPIFIVTAILVRINLGAPVIFSQNRPGLNERVFKMYKFRTMTSGKDENGELLPDEMRLTKFGKFLRSTSIDELPELWNIIRGDMSIVGPRPLLIEYLELYDQEQKKRHLVRPGLTGLAQVKGRNAVSWDDRFKLDIQYANDITFMNDWKIILATVGKVIRRDGVSASNHVTMEAFKGSASETMKIKE